MIRTDIPRADYAHIGGSGTWGGDFPDNTGIEGIKVLERDMEFETPYGTTVPMMLFEIPAEMTADHKAHTVLESVCLDKLTMHEKQKLSVTFAELVYNGQWFTPLREALAAFVDKTQETVTGKVRLKLYKGNMINAGVWSEFSLYSEEIATFGESDYNQADAAGFINLYGLPIKVKAMVDAKNQK